MPRTGSLFSISNGAVISQVMVLSGSATLIALGPTGHCVAMATSPRRQVVNPGSTPRQGSRGGAMTTSWLATTITIIPTQYNSAQLLYRTTQNRPYDQHSTTNEGEFRPRPVRSHRSRRKPRHQRTLRWQLCFGVLRIHTLQDGVPASLGQTFSRAR